MVSIGEISIPGTASLGLNVQSETDPRAVTGELAAYAGGSETGAGVQYYFYPKKYAFSIVYGASLSIAFSDILAGSVGLKLQLKFLFFSKTWKKEIAKWPGKCSSLLPVDEMCSYDLISVSDEKALGKPIPWATVKMPLPFVRVAPLKDKDITSGDGIERTELDLSRVNKFGYRHQCITVGID